MMILLRNICCLKNMETTWEIIFYPVIILEMFMKFSEIITISV